MQTEPVFLFSWWIAEVEILSDKVGIFDRRPFTGRLRMTRHLQPYTTVRLGKRGRPETLWSAAAGRPLMKVARWRRWKSGSKAPALHIEPSRIRGRVEE